MKYLKQKLSQKYENANEIYELLKQYKLEKILTNATIQIDNKLKNNKIDDLPHFSSLILNDINTIISKVNEQEVKRKLEYFLSDLFQDYFSEISNKQNANKILKEIIENIKTACEYKGYNYYELEKLLSLERQTIVVKKATNGLYYEWLKLYHELDEIAKDLLDKKYIYSVKEFKKLFTPDPIFVRFNKNYKDELILFFHILKEEKLIRPRGKNNSGHFSAFVNYALDNEKNFLIEKKINKEHERLKKNNSKYQLLKEKVKNIILVNIKK